MLHMFKSTDFFKVKDVENKLDHLKLALFFYLYTEAHSEIKVNFLFHALKDDYQDIVNQKP